MQRTAGLKTATFARRALLERRRKIADMSAGLRTAQDEANGMRQPDALDRAADMETHEVLESLQAAEARELGEIDAALQRIDAGTYGRCEQCGSPVAEWRLRAVPHARLCIECMPRRP